MKCTSGSFIATFLITGTYRFVNVVETKAFTVSWASVARCNYTIKIVILNFYNNLKFNMFHIRVLCDNKVIRIHSIIVMSCRQYLFICDSP